MGTICLALECFAYIILKTDRQGISTTNLNFTKEGHFRIVLRVSKIGMPGLDNIFPFFTHETLDFFITLNMMTSILHNCFKVFAAVIHFLKYLC